MRVIGAIFEVKSGDGKLWDFDKDTVDLQKNTSFLLNNSLTLFLHTTIV